ncbi:MAG: PAS domain S-box protein [Burkholderiaceae bacterium]
MPATLSTDDQSAADAARRNATLGIVSLVVAIAATLVALLLFLTSHYRSNAVAPALIAAATWTCALLVRRNRSDLVPHIFVATVMAAAFISIVAFGSVRSAGTVLLTALVVVAGLFVGPRALLATVLTGIGGLGVLIFAEGRGLLRTPQMDAGFAVWLVHATTMTSMAIMIFHARRSLESAHGQTRQELHRRRQTEQERDRLIRRFRRMFHGSPSPMVVQSAISGVILDVNPAFERAYGYTSEQMLGRTDHFFWADPNVRKEHARHLLKQRRIMHYEMQAIRSDGQTCQVLLSSELSDEENDRLVISTLIDVTEQRRVLDELHRSRERFAKAFNFSPLKMTISRLSDGSFIEVNEVEDRVQGLAPQEVVGRTSVEVGTWLTQNDRDAFVALLRHAGRVHGYDTVMRHKDGSLCQARLWAELIDIDNEPCILACTVDVTEEKRREQQLLKLARGMSGTSAQDVFASLTMHMVKLLEADMASVAERLPDGRMRTLAVWLDGRPVPNFDYELPGTPCEAAMIQRELCVFPDALDQQFASHEPLVREGFKAYVGQRLQDATALPLGVINIFWRRPIRLEPDSWAMMSIFAGRANAELLRLQREREVQALNASLEYRVQERTADLKKLNAELDSFAYSVSHDLKSPLRSIDGFTRLLGEQLADRMSPDEAAMMGRIVAATSRMSSLIADLLALARVSQGPLARETVNLSLLVHDILDQEQQRRPDRTIQRVIAPELYVSCDPRLARIALENLLGNALKYSRERNPAIIEVGRGEGAELFVRDNGVGFDIAFADKLFKPFQRLHLPSQFEGTGIGLATVRRIVERHGGQVCGHSESGHGAEFRFSFGTDSGATPPGGALATRQVSTMAGGQ